MSLSECDLISQTTSLDATASFGSRGGSVDVVDASEWVDLLVDNQGRGTDEVTRTLRRRNPRLQHLRTSEWIMNFNCSQ